MLSKALEARQYVVHVLEACNIPQSIHVLRHEIRPPKLGGGGVSLATPHACGRDGKLANQPMTEIIVLLASETPCWLYANSWSSAVICSMGRVLHGVHDPLRPLVPLIDPLHNMGHTTVVAIRNRLNHRCARA